jgi:hypothetical protein
VQNFKMKAGGVRGSNGEMHDVTAKRGCFARGIVGLDRPRNGSVPNLATVKRVPRTRLVPDRPLSSNERGETPGWDLLPASARISWCPH